MLRLRSDEEFAKELGSDKGRVQRYRAKWKSEGYGKHPTQDELTKAGKVNVKKDSDYMTEAQKETTPEVKNQPCSMCGEPTKDPERMCTTCRKNQNRDK